MHGGACTGVLGNPSRPLSVVQGRNIECPGEDPYLSGEYAAAFVNGFERNPSDPGHLQVPATASPRRVRRKPQSAANRKR